MPKSQLDYLFCPFCARTLETTSEEGREIKYCRECSWKHFLKHDIAVAGIAIRYSPLAETLMVLRKREPSKNKWSFPAGYVNFGEHPDTALAREVREETGLTVVRFKLIEEIVSNDDPRSPNQLSRFYKMVVAGEIKNHDREENADIQWQSIQRSAPNPEIAWGNHRRLFTEMKTDIPSITGSHITDWLSFNCQS